jgi:hypothetical protein
VYSTTQAERHMDLERCRNVGDRPAAKIGPREAACCIAAFCPLIRDERASIS